MSQLPEAAAACDLLVEPFDGCTARPSLWSGSGNALNIQKDPDDERGGARRRRAAGSAGSRFSRSWPCARCRPSCRSWKGKAAKWQETGEAQRRQADRLHPVEMPLKAGPDRQTLQEMEQLQPAAGDADRAGRPPPQGAAAGQHPTAESTPSRSDSCFPLTCQRYDFSISGPVLSRLGLFILSPAIKPVVLLTPVKRISLPCAGFCAQLQPGRAFTESLPAWAAIPPTENPRGQIHGHEHRRPERH